MCPTGSYPQQLEAAPFAEKVMSATDFASSLDYARMLREAVGHADMPFPPGAFKPTQELPASVPSVQGPIVRTVHEDGTVTEVATGWDFARDPVIRNQGFWNATQTTTKKDANGNVTGTSTTGATNPSGTPAPNPDDACSVDPGRLGCIGLGEPPSDQVPKREVSVSFEAEDIGLEAACPAPLSMGDAGQLSFQPACDAAVMARPVILAVAAFTALSICVFGVRAQG
jgi:hypothetical protein